MAYRFDSGPGHHQLVSNRRKPSQNPASPLWQRALISASACLSKIRQARWYSVKLDGILKWAERKTPLPIWANCRGHSRALSSATPSATSPKPRHADELHIPAGDAIPKKLAPRFTVTWVNARRWPSAPTHYPTGQSAHPLRRRKRLIADDLNPVQAGRSAREARYSVLTYADQTSGHAPKVDAECYLYCGSAKFDRESCLP